MQIHVVEPGQSLYGIARAYSVTPESIVEANQLNGLPYLVVGQALVIPITGRSTGSSQGTPSGPSASGSAWRRRSWPASTASPRVRCCPSACASTYRPARGRKSRPTPTWSPSARASARTSSPVVGDGALPHLPGPVQLPGAAGRLPPAAAARRPAEIAREGGAVPMLVVTNLEEGGFSAELGQAILNDQAVQDRLLQECSGSSGRWAFGMCTSTSSSCGLRTARRTTGSSGGRPTSSTPRGPSSPPPWRRRSARSRRASGTRPTTTPPTGRRWTSLC